MTVALYWYTQDVLDTLNNSLELIAPLPLQYVYTPAGCWSSVRDKRWMSWNLVWAELAS